MIEEAKENVENSPVTVRSYGQSALTSVGVGFLFAIVSGNVWSWDWSSFMTCASIGVLLHAWLRDRQPPERELLS